MSLPKHCKGCYYRRNLGNRGGEKFARIFFLKESRAVVMWKFVIRKRRISRSRRKSVGRTSIDNRTTGKL